DRAGPHREGPRTLRDPGSHRITKDWIDARLASGFEPDHLMMMLRASDEEAGHLYSAARRVRDDVFGPKAFIRAVVEFSNQCRCNCLYCGMRKDNELAVRFMLEQDEIVSLARRAQDWGIRTFFLQAAENETYNADWLASVISEIHGLGMAVLLCVGIHREEDLDLWYEAGARKFILKHEISDPELFGRMKPGLELADRVEWLRVLKRHRYHTGSGPLLGLPGQTIDTLVGDLVLMKELAVDMSSIALFLPAKGTPLEDWPVGDVELGLRFIAAMRLYLRDTLIPATSTFERLTTDGQLRCFQAGANVITVNMTPQRLRDDYELYSDRYYVRLEHARNTIRRASLEECTEGDVVKET
ncbi:[FeFe] hydrogenase H-cluster radical SAM maturase HydE, partial [Candidatus Fermentibacterales bacterium]|nr:[FeFe] hydrogenase H-cluster radical SAM maturase HydE [Candidatus Fermentibacterales bacterium]